MIKYELSIFWAVLIVQLCSSCTIISDETIKQLEQINSLAEYCPDSALTAIRSISTDQFITARGKALYALTYCKTMNMNKIEISDETLILPALEYFKRKGRKSYKAETYYLAALIYENGGENDEAIKMLLKAEKNLEGVTELETAPVYGAKGRIYYNSMEFSRSAHNYSTAAGIYRRAGNTDLYASYKIKEAECRLRMKKYHKAEEIASEIKKILPQLSLDSINRYYRIAISIEGMTCVAQAIGTVEEYISKMNDTGQVDWMLVSRIRLAGNDFIKAQEALDKYIDEGNEPGVEFYYCQARIYELKGYYKEAAQTYRNLIAIEASIGQSILCQDTKFVEEREMHRTIHENDKIKRRFLLLDIFIIVTCLISATFRLISARNDLMAKECEKANLKRELEAITTERDELGMLETENAESKKIITERLEMINQYVIGHIFNDDLLKNKVLKTFEAMIGDRQEFVRQNRLIFNLSSRKFIKYLISKGLSDREIDHCCLYAIGMNGKMVTSFTNIKRHYHIGSDVRKKLGLGWHDTNISIHIRNIYNAIGSEKADNGVQLL